MGLRAFIGRVDVTVRAVHGTCPAGAWPSVSVCAWYFAPTLAITAGYKSFIPMCAGFVFVDVLFYDDLGCSDDYW